MYRKILIGGVTAAAIVGAGGTALAVSGSASPSSTPSASSSSGSTSGSTSGKHTGKHSGKGHGMLKRLAHGSFVVQGKNGTFETADLIKGTVIAVSASSITVQAADKTSETFAVDKDTKVRVREAGSKGAASTIAKVAKGDHVLVLGTGTSKYVAKHVVDVKGK